MPWDIYMLQKWESANKFTRNAFEVPKEKKDSLTLILFFDVEIYQRK